MFARGLLGALRRRPRGGGRVGVGLRSGRRPPGRGVPPGPPGFPAALSRVVSSRVYHTRLHVVRNSTSNRIGRSLASLHPTWVTGLCASARPVPTHGEIRAGARSGPSSGAQPQRPVRRGPQRRSVPDSKGGDDDDAPAERQARQRGLVLRLPLGRRPPAPEDGQGRDRVGPHPRTVDRRQRLRPRARAGLPGECRLPERAGRRLPPEPARRKADLGAGAPSSTTSTTTRTTRRAAAVASSRTSTPPAGVS